MGRFLLGLKALWRTWTRADFADRVEPLFEGTPTGPDLRVLAVLQRDGRLVDFLMEDVDGYGDAQIGAAARDIHRGCRKVLREYLTLEPVLDAAEDSAVTVPAGFDPAEIRVTGSVAGAPPFSGRLRHHGWKVRAVHLPMLPGARAETAVLAPAEVEVE